MRLFVVPAMVSLALAFAVHDAAAKPDRAETGPVCGSAAVCGPQSVAPSSALRLADYADQQKIESYFRCCQRFIRGQPLKGVFCSRKDLDMALSRHVIRLWIDPSTGQSSCSITGQPL